MTSLPDRADVVVVGAGVVGLATARALLLAGREVVVVDRGEPGRATSWGNCGLITPSYSHPLTDPASLRLAMTTLFDRRAPLRVAFTLDPTRIRWLLGFARRCTAEHMAVAQRARHDLLAVSRRSLEALVDEASIECEWETEGLMTVFATQEALEHHAAEMEVLAAWGIESTVVAGEELRRRNPRLAAGVAGAVHTPGDAQLRPAELSAGLVREVDRLGGTVVPGVAVKRLRVGQDGVEGLDTDRGPMTARDVVIAAGPWSSTVARTAGLALPVQPGKGYSITWPATVDGLSDPMLFEETKVAVTPWSSSFRIGSTMEIAGFDDSLRPERLELLTTGVAPYLDPPLELGPGEPWFGFRPLSVDEIPIVGPSSRHRGVHFACGHGFLGVSLATGTAQLVAELMDTREPHVDPSPYDPGRFGI